MDDIQEQAESPRLTRDGTGGKRYTWGLRRRIRRYPNAAEILIGNCHTGLITNLLLGRVLPESKIAKALLYPITPSKLLLSNCPFVVAERRTCGIK